MAGTTAAATLAAAATTAIRKTVIAFSPASRRGVPMRERRVARRMSGGPAGHQYAFLEIGICLRRRDDLIVLVNGQALVTDGTHGLALDLIGQALLFVLVLHGRHVLLKRLAQLHDLRNRLADLGNHLIRHVPALQCAVSTWCVWTGLGHGFLLSRFRSGSESNAAGYAPFPMADR